MHTVERKTCHFFVSSQVPKIVFDAISDSCKDCFVSISSLSNNLLCAHFASCTVNIMFDLRSLVISVPCTVMCLNDVLYIKSSRRTFVFFAGFFFLFVCFMFWSCNIVAHCREVSCCFKWVCAEHDVQFLHQAAEGESSECLWQTCWRCV